LFNAERVMFGDFVMVRTCQDVKRGEEITINYVPDDLKIEVNESILRSHYYMECDCAFCETVRHDMDARQIFNRMRGIQPLSTHQELEEAIRIFQQADSQCPHLSVKPGLGSLAHVIADAFALFGNSVECARYHQLAIERRPNFWERISASFRGGVTHLKLGNVTRAIELLAYAYQETWVHAGLDFETFSWLYKADIKTFQLTPLLDRARRLCSSRSQLARHY
jgi:hypothetical protein